MVMAHAGNVQPFRKCAMIHSTQASALSRTAREKRPAVSNQEQADPRFVSTHLSTPLPNAFTFFFIFATACSSPLPNPLLKILWTGEVPYIEPLNVSESGVSRDCAFLSR